MRLSLLFLLIVQIGFSQHLVLQGVNIVPIHSNTVLAGYDVFIKAVLLKK